MLCVESLTGDRFFMQKSFAFRRVIFVAGLCLAMAFAARSELLWQAHNPSPKTGNLSRLVFGGDGALVALYNSEPGLAVSTNGTNWWWERTANPRARVGDAVWGNGKWVITTPSTNSISNTTVQVSTDLRNWTAIELTTGRAINRVTYGNGKFWLLGATNVVSPVTYASTDGANWTLLPPSNLPLEAFTSVTYDPANNLLIGVGAVGVSPPMGRVVTSPNGTNWTVRLDNLTNGTLRNVRAANGVTITCGDISTNLYRSTDGIAWTRVTVAESFYLYNQLASDTTNWLCMDNDGYFIRSTNNGATWNLSGSTGWNPPYYIAGTAFRTNDGRWYGSGRLGLVVATTNFGNPWTNVQSGTLSDFKAIAQGAGRLVTAGTAGVLYSSPEGTNWQSVASGTTANFYTIRFLNGAFYAFDGGARVSKSTDGISFVSSNMTPQNVRDALYDGTKLVGWRGGQTSFFQSANGINWSNYPGTVVPATQNGTLYKVGSGYLYVDGNNLGSIYFCTSQNLTNWSTNILNNYYGGFSHDIAQANGNFYYTYPGGVLFSTDGVGASWTNITLSANWTPNGGALISVSNRLYTAAGNPNYGRLIFSDDGTNWYPSPVTLDISPSGGLSVSWLYTGTRLVDTGSKGNIASLAVVLDGSTNNSTGGTGQTYAAWSAQYTFPGGLSNPGDDPDLDGLPNLAEYVLGGSPVDAASKNFPQTTIVSVSGQNYPAITYIHNKTATGATVQVVVGTDLTFASPSGTTEVLPRQDLGSNLERVTVRANNPLSTFAMVLFKVSVSVP